MDVAVTWFPVLFLLLYVALLVMMVASVRDSGLDPSAKVAWIALIVIAPLLGWMLWLLVGRRLAGPR